MGLLDALSDPNGADPASGLLSFLANLQKGAPPSQTGPMPSDMAQYGPTPAPPAPVFAPNASPLMNAANAAGAAQPSPLDNAQYPYGPNGAPSQANAQMPGAQPAPMPAIPMAQPAAATGPNFLNKINNGLQSIGHGGSLIGALTGNYTDPTSKAAQVANLTFHALTAKGVNPQIAAAAIAPGNTELLKTLVTQTFGPQTVQSLGEGYVYDPKTGKTTRAYEPDDKTPPSVLEYQYYLKNLPQGQTPMDYASFSTQKSRAASANPNVPQVLGRGAELYKLDANGNPTIIHKNESEADASLDDKTTQAMASQYLAGDKSVMTNLGRGAQGAANIVKLRTEIYKQAGDQGLDGRAIVNNFNEQAGALAGQRTVGTRAANISLAANEANNMIPIALAASEQVPRSQYMPWNKMVQAVQKGASSPELASFVAATNSLVNSYVRAVSPGGVPTDSMRDHAYSMLNSAQGPEAFKAVVSTMQKEMQSALNAPAQVKKELRGETSTPSSGKSGGPTPGNYVWSPDKGLVAQ